MAVVGVAPANCPKETRPVGLIGVESKNCPLEPEFCAKFRHSDVEEEGGCPRLISPTGRLAWPKEMPLLLATGVETDSTTGEESACWRGPEPTVGWLKAGGGAEPNERVFGTGGVAVGCGVNENGGGTICC